MGSSAYLRILLLDKIAFVTSIAIASPSVVIATDSRVYSLHALQQSNTSVILAAIESIYEEHTAIIRISVGLACLYFLFDPFCIGTVSYTHLRAHETGRNLVCRLLL